MICQCGVDPVHTVGYCAALRSAQKESKGVDLDTFDSLVEDEVEDVEGEEGD